MVIRTSTANRTDMVNVTNIYLCISLAHSSLFRSGVLRRLAQSLIPFKYPLPSMPPLLIWLSFPVIYGQVRISPAFSYLFINFLHFFSSNKVKNMTGLNMTGLNSTVQDRTRLDLTRLDRTQLNPTGLVS